MPSIRLETHRWPIVVTVMEGELDEGELALYLEEFLTRVVDRKEPFGAIIDARRLTSLPSAKARRMIADWENENAARGSRYHRGAAFVSESTLVRGVMTAIGWIAPPRIPMVFEATMEAGEAWVRSRLAETGTAARAG